MNLLEYLIENVGGGAVAEFIRGVKTKSCTLPPVAAAHTGFSPGGRGGGVVC